MARPRRQPPLWPRPQRQQQQQGPSHPHPPPPPPPSQPLPPPGRRPLRPCPPSPPQGPAAPASPRKPLQSQQRTRKGISRPWSFSSAPAPGDHHPSSCCPGPLRLPSLSPFPWTDRARAAGGPPRAGAQRVSQGPGQARACCLWRHRLSVCSSVFLAISPCLPSTIGNHGEATWRCRDGGARRGSGWGPYVGRPWPFVILSLVPWPRPSSQTTAL